jgi:oligopeptide transport system substrate-binding protein
MTHFTRNQETLYQLNNHFLKKIAADSLDIRQLFTAMRFLSHILLSITALTFFVSCKGERTVDKATEEKIFLYGNSDEPEDLDPQVVTGVIESNIINSLFEGLCVQHPEKEGVHLPGVAESWQASEDFKTWTFQLRKDAKWSDGTPLTTADFLFSYERILRPAFAAKFCEMLYFIKNAEEFNKGEVTDFNEVGVKALDAHTLQIDLKAPTPFLPDLTKHYTWFPVPKHVILQFGDIDTKHTTWTDPDKLVSNGAFKLDSWRFNQFIEVVKNPYYWDKENVQLEGVKFIPVKNVYTEARMFFDGQLHATYTLAPEMIQYARDNYPENLRQEPYFNSYFLRCNVLSDKVKDINVRKALAFAVDRQSLIDNILQGGQTPAYALVPPIGEYQSPKVVDFDIQKAKDALAEAGYGPNKPLRLRLLATDKDSTKRLCEAMQAMWKQTLGVEVAIEQFEWKTYLDKVHKGDYDICIGGWAADYPDVSTFLDMWKKGGGNNRTNWHSDEYEELLEQGAQASDPTERIRILEKAEARFLTDMPIIPLYWATTVYLIDNSVKGWHPLLLNNHPYKFIDLENN